MFKQFLRKAGYITIPFPANLDKGNIIEPIANQSMIGGFSKNRNGSHIGKAFLTYGHNILEVNF
jgi:hypothetical protein